LERISELLGGQHEPMAEAWDEPSLAAGVQVAQWHCDRPWRVGELHQVQFGVGRKSMQLSARNQLRGTIVAIKLGTVMAEVILKVGENEIVAAITRSSVERLGLKEGDTATAIIKSTDVMIGK
jgi:molybdopterin-binding protein